jgi:hypothetical protein
MPTAERRRKREAERKKTHTHKNEQTYRHTHTHTHTHSIVKILTFDKTANNVSGSAVGLGGEREATANKQAAGKESLVRCARGLV